MHDPPLRPLLPVGLMDLLAQVIQNFTGFMVETAHRILWDFMAPLYAPDLGRDFFWVALGMAAMAAVRER